jgi:tRNA A-37 threonylcarbamoyl transferase component Bud32
MPNITDRLTAALADRYRIERELGQGGMATVYLAEDLKHRRKVALKVLKPELAAVLGADRFVQEITTTAALQHPHILPLFDSGTADGFLFYVMPFIEGETLRDKLNRETQLAIDESVRIASEVADALGYAHGKGVIHRDIKPENILLANGRPMVADFGIALAVSAAAGGRMTETGLSLGTPHYMSPEQATADKEISARSDVYSLASVLYEMLAGNPPHTGASAQQIIMKIIAEPVPLVTTLRKSVPSHVAATLAKALEKLPADRFRSAHEFVEALQGRGSPLLPTTGVTAPHESRSRWRDPVVIGLATLLVTTGTLAAWQWTAARREKLDAVIQFGIDLPRYVSTGLPIGAGVAISKDGRTLAYIGGAPGSAGQLALVRSMDDIRSRPVPGTEETQSIFLSPDGKWLGFWTKGRLSKVSLDGGAPIILADSLPVFNGASWSSRGVIVAALGGQLMTIPDSGGVFQPVTASNPDAQELQQYPTVLADGETVVYTRSSVAQRGGARLAVASLTTGLMKSLDVVGTSALGVVDTHLVYGTSTNQLMAVPFDIKGARVTGTPTQVGTAMLVGGRGVPIAALSSAGVLVFQTGSRASEMVLVDRRGVARALLPESRVYGYPRFSPDGRRVAVSIEASGRRDVWLHDRDGGTLVRFTDNGQSERPEFTPDGSSSIWWRPTDRSAAAAPLFTSGNVGLWEAVMTRDGKDVVLQRDISSLRQGANVVVRSVAGDTSFVSVAATRAEETQARPSPDGRWVAFQSNASGINQVVVQPLREPGGQVVVSPSFGTEPVWSQDGKYLYYRDATQFIEVAVTTSPEFAVTSRTPLFADPFVFAPAPHANYDVAPDRTAFVALRPTEGVQLVVVHNWRSELRGLLASRQR